MRWTSPRFSKQQPAQPAQHSDAPAWHAVSAADVLATLESGPTGLTDTDAQARLSEHGPNALPTSKPRHPLLAFLSQFHNTLIYALLVAAAAAALLGHALDAMVIAMVVLVNAVVGFLQEGRAENALAAIRSMISPRAHVLRNGVRTVVPVADLVPGDLVLLEAGDRVPADLRLLRARGLLIDEALLTGESLAAQKQDGVAPKEAPLGDRHSMAYSGSLVVAGQASAVVVATGPRTELGRIGALLSTVEGLTTPLLRQVNRFGRRFALLVAGCAALLFAYAVYARGWDWGEALMAVVALAVSAIPEGLPAVITITLAVGVQRMAGRNAVIRRLPAVETLGATSVICTDKTGTLTRNEMTARRVVCAGHTLLAEGNGYAPEGHLQSADGNGTDDAAAIAAALPILRCGVLCNDARLHTRSGQWTVTGDPVEGALLALAGKAGVDAEHERSEWRRTDEIPFDAAHRFMATLNEGSDGTRQIFVKGAPEAVLEMDPSLRREGASSPWLQAMATAAADGERLLGFAEKRVPPGHDRLAFEDLSSGVRWLGLVGFIDPPRVEAREAIAQCRAAGIRVKMITGDHAATATAVARQLKLSDAPQTLSGTDLDRLPDQALPEAVQTTDVFARAAPQHKLRIVRALQSVGHVVAMTGDGVNDAPSLKQADVGVAMGIKGTEAAKESAEMVLLDDNFASIVNAVHEGRTVHDNIRKVIAWTLPTNGGEVLGVIVAVLFGLTLPMSAAQILWVNLVTSVTLGLALAFEPAEDGVMQRRPRKPDAPLLSPFVLWRTVLVSVLMGAMTLGLFAWSMGRGDSLEHARTLVVNAMTALELAYLFSVRYLHARSFTMRGVMGTRAVLAAIGGLVMAQALFTYLPPMNRLFATVPLPPGDLAIAALAGLALMILLELEKTLFRRLLSTRGPLPPGDAESAGQPG